jgi:ParB family transcriptional regulator, chromosome partitioning protein
MAKRTGLGKGLDALIPQSIPSAIPKTGIKKIAPHNIVPNPKQPRTYFNPIDLEDLSNSIKEHGVIQPLIVMPGDSVGKYILIAGERRLQASLLAKLSEVPVVVREVSGDQELLELALIENVQRADLSPLETAEAYSHMSKEFNLTQGEIAKRVGKSRVSVTNKISLLTLSKPVKKSIASGEISEGHGRAIIALSTQAQNAVLTVIIEKSLSVRQTEELARNYKGEKSKDIPKKAAPPPEIEDIENRIQQTLSVPTKVTYSKGKGTITLRFFSDEELNQILDKLLDDMS